MTQPLIKWLNEVLRSRWPTVKRLFPSLLWSFATPFGCLLIEQRADLCLTVWHYLWLTLILFLALIWTRPFVFASPVFTHVSNILLKIVLCAFLATAIAFRLFGLTDNVRLAEYIALFAVFVALGHCIELARTNLDVRHSLEEIQKLRGDLRFEDYVKMAYLYYASAKKRILACVRCWTIDSEWLRKHRAELDRTTCRCPIKSDAAVPYALAKYYRDSALATSIRNLRDTVDSVSFVGPIDINTEDGLVTFPGALWRSLFVEAANQETSRSKARPKPIAAFAFHPPFHFVVVDKKVLMAQFEAPPLRTLKEPGLDLGEHPSLARHLISEFTHYLSTPAFEAINAILRTALTYATVDIGGPLTSLHAEHVFKILYRLELVELEARGSALATVDDAKKALDLLRNDLNVSESDVSQIIVGLIWDYLVYVGRSKFKTTVNEE